MLKIWLTWLQPSLGVLGIVLVLSSSLSSYAAPKPTGLISTSKTPYQTVGRSNGTTIDRELLNGISATPDFAIRQLAIHTMLQSGVKSTSFAAQAPKASRDALASIVTPSAEIQRLSASVSKPQFVKHSVSSAVAYALEPSATMVVPGLAIGTSNVRVSSQFLPESKPVVRSVAAKPIAHLTPTTPLVASASVADPFPVVRPERMQSLKMDSALATVPTIGTKQLTENSIAGITVGLQGLLGNKPAVSLAPVANAIGGIKTDSMLALNHLVSPTTSLQTTVNGASLQLATAQSYTSAPKFNIPGESILALTPAKPAHSEIAVKGVGQNLSTAVVQRKSNYVALMSDRFLTSREPQSWTTVSQSSHLGGLILGSQSRSISPNTLSLLPPSSLKTLGSNSLPMFSLATIN
jgi:hypothetical protein